MKQMTMKRPLWFAVMAVMLWNSVALAVNSVVVESKNVPTGATGVEIHVFLTNNIDPWSGIVVPLVIREVTPGAFITSLQMSFADRLASPNVLDLKVRNQYASGEDGNCKGGSPGGFHTLAFNDGGPHPVAASPVGLMFVRLKNIGTPLNPGADATGSMIMTVNVTSTPGEFEIDTTCTDPANHLMAIDAATQPIPLTFTKGVIQTACGDLSFRPNPDGWSFANTQSNMWPSSSVFPDWSLFVLAFGENQCYWDPPPGRVVLSLGARIRCYTIQRKWEGSSFGFAISSFLFFDQKLQVFTEFPPKTALYDVLLSLGAFKPRTMINKYSLYQFGKNQMAYINLAKSSVQPTQTLQACRDMFFSTTRNDRILLMYNNPGQGSHAVNPYRCEVDAAHPETTRVYVYDNNFPGDDNKWVSINTNTNTWSYHGQKNKNGTSWTGSKYLFLMDPVSNYMTKPIIAASIPPRDRGIGQVDAGLSSYVEMYLPPAGNARLESALGSIGLDGDSLFSTLTDGMPITPITGQETPPIGYYLPSAPWTITLTGASDSLQRLSLFTDSTVLVYSRTLTDSVRNERLRYLGDDRSLWVQNPGTTSRSYDIEVVSTAPDSEVACKVWRIGIGPGDSALYSITTGMGLVVENHGPATTYDVSVEIASANGDTLFFHSGIPIDSNSAHQIVPDWRPYGDSLLILVDSSLSGTFTDTIRVENQDYCDCPRQGDIDGSGFIDVQDVLRVIQIAFLNGTDVQDPRCPKTRGDADNSGVVDVNDVLYIIRTAFLNGPPPVDPCGP